MANKLWQWFLGYIRGWGCDFPNCGCEEEGECDVEER